MQVASIATVSPAQALHVHVGVADEDDTEVIMHAGHSFVAAQQPLLPGLEPSAHFAAEAQAAAKTSTRNAVRLGAMFVAIFMSIVRSTSRNSLQRCQD